MVNRQLANLTLRTVWDILEQGIEVSKASSAILSPDFSLYDYFRDICDDRVRAGDMESHERDLVLGMGHMWGAYVGDRVERQSMKFFFLEDCIDGGEPLPYGQPVTKTLQMTALYQATTNGSWQPLPKSL